VGTQAAGAQATEVQQAARDAGARARAQAAGAATPPAGAVAAARLLMAAAGTAPSTDDVQAAENADADTIAATAHAAGLGMPLGAAAAHAAGLGMLVGAAFPPPPPPPTSTLATALAAARAAAAEGQTRVRAAALAWERERDAADALARQIAEAEQLLIIPTSHDVGATSSGSTGPRVSHTAVIWHDPADPLVVQLHYQAGGPEHPAPGPDRPRAGVTLLRPLEGPGPPHPLLLRPRQPRPPRRRGRGPDRLVAAP